jgi:hypothetical protein
MAARRRRGLPPAPTPGQWPSRLHWRPRIRVWALVFGALLGVGTAVLLQQYGYRVMTRDLLVQALISGLLTGLVVPSLRWAFAVRRYNHTLDKARARALAMPA